MPIETTRSVAHRTGGGNPSGLRALDGGVREMSVSELLAAIEAEVAALPLADVLNGIAATARLSAVLMARVLSPQETRSSPPPSSDLLDVKSAARKLACSRPTVYRMAKAGELPSVRIGDALRFDPADLSAWITRRKARS